MAGGADSPDSDLTIAPVVGAGDARRFTDSGIEVAAAYEPPQQPPRAEAPGEFPYTRGIHAEMYRERLWTMRQYAGYASAEESNARYRYLLAQGSTGLSMAFDLPTQLGLDSDDPRSAGEVGRTGVAIDTLDDMRAAFAEIPLDQVSVSMTINAPAAVLLCLYELVAAEQGVAPEALRGTSQNDILKEYIARGNYIYPPGPSMRLTTDLFAYCAQRMPQWNTISISGYHYREKGASAVQEVAFTLASGIAYVDAAIAAGLEVDDFAPRLAFFFNAHNHVFQEVAKFRAARRMWARIMRERFGAKNPRTWMLRAHAQTAGVSLVAQQPLNNVVRTTLQALAAVLGGTQSLHTNSFDETYALPTEESASLALRTQQIIAEESGIPAVADPLGGSYFVEALTDRMEEAAEGLIRTIDGMGGMVAAVEAGWPQREIAASAYRTQRQIDSGQRVVVGVNRHVTAQAAASIPTLKIDGMPETVQLTAIRELRARREAQHPFGPKPPLPAPRPKKIPTAAWELPMTMCRFRRGAQFFRSRTFTFTAAFAEEWSRRGRSSVSPWLK